MSLLNRLSGNGERDLAFMVRQHRTTGLPRVATTLAPVFSHARTHPARYHDTPPVLAFSIGGSNVKVMLAEMSGGEVLVHHVIARANPTEPTDVAEFFDTLLLDEPVFADYLRHSRNTLLGLSIAVGIIDGVPWHATKIPHVRGLVARDLVRDAATHHLGRNLSTYFTARGITPPRVRYEGDCPLAHFGSVVMAGLRPDQPSCLAICGTGMASADDREFLLFGNVPVLAQDDPAVYPLAETENGQLQYSVAGKGLAGLMRRAVLLRAGETDALPASAADAFPTPAQSRLVGELWESTLPGGVVTPRLEALGARYGTVAFTEMQVLASRIMERAISGFTNNTLMTLVYMTERHPSATITLFTEGSIARNPAVYPRFLTAMHERLAEPRRFTHLDIPAPRPPVVIDDVRRLRATANCGPRELAEVDITLIGAACLGLAQQWE